MRESVEHESKNSVGKLLTKHFRHAIMSCCDKKSRKIVVVIKVLLNLNNSRRTKNVKREGIMKKTLTVEESSKKNLRPFEIFTVGTPEIKDGKRDLFTECVVIPVVRPISISDTSRKGRIVFQGNFMGEFEEFDYLPVPIFMLGNHKPENCRMIRIPESIISVGTFCVDISQRSPEKLINKECIAFKCAKQYQIGHIRIAHLEGRRNLFTITCGNDVPFIFSSKKPSPIIGELVYDAGRKES